MTTEQLVRDQLDRATRDVPEVPTWPRPSGSDAAGDSTAGPASPSQRSPSSARAPSASGPPSRAVPTTARDNPAADAGVADVPVADAPVADAPRSGDYVVGTDIDERMAATVAAHLPGLPAADDVYPSDTEHRGPMPDADFAQATDWQAAYTTPSSQVLLIMALAVETPQPFSCDGCTATQVPGGTLYRQKFTSAGDQWFGTYYARDDGSVVNAFEYVPVGNAADRVVTDKQLAELVQDPELRFG